MMRRKLLFIALFLSVLGITVLLASFVVESREESAGEEMEGLIQATLSVAEQNYEAWIPEGATVYDLMKVVAEQSEFEFRGKDFWGLGFFVEEINGIAQSPKEKMYWIYYVNGEKALVGVSRYVVQINDVISWKYEKER